MTAAEAIQNIKVGDRVTINVPNGIGREGVEYKPKTGKAVIVRPDNSPHVVLNMGGKFGTPGVATEENIVAVPRLKFRAD